MNHFEQIMYPFNALTLLNCAATACNLKDKMEVEFSFIECQAKSSCAGLKRRCDVTSLITKCCHVYVLFCLCIRESCEVQFVVSFEWQCSFSLSIRQDLALANAIKETVT